MKYDSDDNEEDDDNAGEDGGIKNNEQYNGNEIAEAVNFFGGEGNDS